MTYEDVAFEWWHELRIAEEGQERGSAGAREQGSEGNDVQVDAVGKYDYSPSCGNRQGRKDPPLLRIGSGVFEITLPFRGDAEMKNDDMELVRGSGNVYGDFGYPDADVRQLKSILAAQILKILERDKLSVREAQRRTGIAAADFSRIRKVKLERFTIDRLLTIVNKLGTRIAFKITARRERQLESAAA